MKPTATPMIPGDATQRQPADERFEHDELEGRPKVATPLGGML
jgi:hypothetical protein